MSDTTSKIAELLGNEFDEEVDTDGQVFGEEDETDEEVEETSEEQATESDDLSWGKALGIDDDKIILDDDGNITGIKVKVDDVESTVALKDLVAGYQFNAHNTQRSQALAKERTEFTEQVKQYQQKAQAELQMHEQLASVIAQQVLGSYADLDWEKFNQENPAEAAKAYGEYRKRDDYFKNLVSVVQQQIQENTQQLAAQQQREVQEYTQQQLQHTLYLIPEWNNREIVTKELQEIKTVMAAHGFGDEDIASIQDARVFAILRDYAKLKGALTNVQSTVKQTPKVHGNVGNNSANKVNRLVNKAKAAKNTHQQAALKTAAIAALLGG